jgi:hypothetical protein
VSDFTISKDGSKVLFRGDLTTDDIFEIYAADIDGSNSVKLSSTSHPTGDVVSYRISNDNFYAVYWGDLNNDGLNELYSAPTSGSGSQVRLNRPVSGSLRVYNTYEISPDSTMVSFASNVDGVGDEALYRVPIAGGADVRLTPTLVGSTINALSYTSDSQNLLYLAEQDLASSRDLYAVSMTASTPVPVRLSVSSGVGSDVSSYKLSDDDTKVLFSGDVEVPNFRELFLNSVSGGTQQKVSANLPNTSHNVRGFSFKPGTNDQFIYTKYDDDLDQRMLVGVSASALQVENNLSPSGLASGGSVFEGVEFSSVRNELFYKADLLDDGNESLHIYRYESGQVLDLNITLPTNGTLERYSSGSDTVIEAAG